MGNVIVFGNQKGGVGKSTLSVLYAFWLADMHRQSICFVDLDTQGNSSKTLHCFNSGWKSVDLFSEPGTVSVAASTSEGQRRIALVAATKQLPDIELRRPESVIPAFRASIACLLSSFDVVVIDTPPSLGLRMSGALMAASHVVCPIELEEYSIDGVTDMLKTVFGIRQRYNPKLELAGIMLNRYNPHSPRQKRAIEQLVMNYTEFIIPARISTRSAIPEALAECKAVWELTKTSAREASAEVKAAFMALQGRIEARQGGEP
ncbi:MAG: ParA family protein [Alcaligenaceae bacterium]|nr:MAG: ParA family protein [Alcaligenaceae bacterium]